MTLASVLATGALRAALVLPFALLVPGYALLRAAVPSRELRDPFAGVALGVVLSFAFYMAVTLAMTAASVKYSDSSVLIASDVGIALLALVAFVRGATAASAALGVRRAVRSAVFVVAIASAVTLAVVLKDALPGPQPQEFTQFYITGPIARASGPVRLAGGESLHVSLAVTDHSRPGQLARSYRITSRVDQRSSSVLATRTLAPGQTWTYTAAVPIPRDGALHHVRFGAQATPGRRPLSVGLFVVAPWGKSR
jgi:uncharacterized membrane protein